MSGCGSCEWNAAATSMSVPGGFDISQDQSFITGGELSSVDKRQTVGASLIPDELKE